MAGAGPVRVITDKCVLECDEDGELALASLYPGVEVEDVRRDVGWTLRVREPLRRATLPDDAVLRFLREHA
jgi:acyl CoA:acetate/3-ketoacid CoA transferase beta subunit